MTIKKGSKGELLLEALLEERGIVYEKEYKFHPTRKWRFDFALLKPKIGIEVEGGIWIAGRHSRGAGFEADCRKYGEAAILGWRILRVSTGMVSNGEAMDLIGRALTASS